MDENKKTFSQKERTKTFRQLFLKHNRSLLNIRLCFKKSWREFLQLFANNFYLLEFEFYFIGEWIGKINPFHRYPERKYSFLRVLV